MNALFLCQNRVEQVDVTFFDFCLVETLGMIKIFIKVFL